MKLINGSSGIDHTTVSNTPGVLPIERVRDERQVLIRAEIPSGAADIDVMAEVTLSDGLLELSLWYTELMLESSASNIGPVVFLRQLQRWVAIPDGVGDRDIQSSLEDGVLEVRVALDNPAEGHLWHDHKRPSQMQRKLVARTPQQQFRETSPAALTHYD